MKYKYSLTLVLWLYSLVGKSQMNEQPIDSLMAKKITISGFCLCKTTITDLKNIDNEVKTINVEEMDLCNNGFTQDSRFENQKGYYSTKYPGIIFQKDNDNDFISKIRLTKDFIGKLPDGTYIDMKNIYAKDILKIYPNFNNWGSRGCSNYWKLSNDTLSFFVKINKDKTPRYPVDEAYYSEMPIEGVDLIISCYSLSHKKDEFVLFAQDEPMFFVDSIRVNKSALETMYQPTEFAFISVYKDSNAIRIAGKDAKNGAIYLTTKLFAREHYWNYFISKSNEYQRLVPDIKTESEVVYVLNNKVLETNFEKELFEINDSNFLDLTIIKNDQFKKDYKIADKSIGVSIRTK